MLSAIVQRSVLKNRRFCTTFDHEEISKFSKLSKNWWMESNTLRSMNRLRVPFIRDNLLVHYREKMISQPSMAEPLKHLKIIEIGCGGGILAEPLRKLGANLTAIDASEDMIRVARNHAIKFDIDYKVSSLESYVQNGDNGAQFDAVIASEVIEHVSDKQKFVRNCSHLLKPNGALFLTTINKNLVSKIGAIFIAEQLLKLVPANTHDWNKFISEIELEKLLVANDFQVKQLHGMAYNFLSDYWFWTKCTAINFALFAVKN